MDGKVSGKEELLKYVRIERDFYKDKVLKQDSLHKKETAHLYAVNREYWNTIQKTKKIRSDVATYKTTTLVFGILALAEIFVVLIVASN